MEPGKKHFQAARNTGKAFLSGLIWQKQIAMNTDFNHLDDEERLAAENNFLKMKLMIERGAEFIGCSDDIPGAIQNEFLNNIIAFEEQFDKRSTIKVFDKIGQPSHFKLAGEIADEKIESAWAELLDYLNEHGIDVGVCSPNITERELYRFVTEELFQYETDDMNMPGWVTHFIYDEFHPDPVYDNSRMVKNELIAGIFQKEELFYQYNYDKNGFSFNNEFYSQFSDFNQKINHFKASYEEIELNNCDIASCIIKGDQCVVTGRYAATAFCHFILQSFEGDFRVDLNREGSGFWVIKDVWIEGFMN